MKQMKENYVSRSDSKQRTQSTSGKPHIMPPNHFTQTRINSFSHSLHELHMTQTGTMQFHKALNNSTRNLNSHVASGGVEMTTSGPF